VGQDLCPDSGFGRASGGFGMKNRMPWVAAGLEMVISGCSIRKSIIAISYGDPGKPTVDELRGILSKYKRNIQVFDTQYSYKLNKKNGSNLREVLIVGS
jgi:hypothetical protein